MQHNSYYVQIRLHIVLLFWFKTAISEPWKFSRGKCSQTPLDPTWLCTHSSFSPPNLKYLLLPLHITTDCVALHYTGMHYTMNLHKYKNVFSASHPPMRHLLISSCNHLCSIPNRGPNYTVITTLNPSDLCEGEECSVTK